MKRRYGPGVRSTGFRCCSTRSARARGGEAGKTADRGRTAEREGETAPDRKGRKLRSVSTPPTGRRILGVGEPPLGRRHSFGARLSLVTLNVSQPATHIAPSLNHSVRALDSTEPRAVILRTPPRRGRPYLLSYLNIEISLAEFARPNVLMSRDRMPLFLLSGRARGRVAPRPWHGGAPCPAGVGGSGSPASPVNARTAFFPASTSWP